MLALRINDSRIDWEDSHSHYLFNPRHPKAKNLKALARKLPFYPGHIYLFSSGGEKICLLSKSAFLASALAVNKNLQTQKKDRWLISLPLFHVAGLSIQARAFAGGFSHKQSAKLWQAHPFQKELKEKKISLSSLVPAQVYDLVRYNLKAPPALRAVIVGGGALSPYLYKKARGLGWPVLISYGLTEAASQVASANVLSLKTSHFPKMKILNHVKIKSLRTKTKIKSPSLLSACFDVQKKTLYNPKDSKGWLELPDKILLKKNSLTTKGRKEEEIKILGEIVSLQKLSFLLEELSHSPLKKFHLTALPDQRRGFRLTLLTSCFDHLKAVTLAQKFNKRVLPYEKITAVYFVPELQKTALLKIRQKDLLRQVGL